MTSVAISTVTWQLSNFGVGIGDLITLAGLGRSAISWLTTSIRDEEFLKLWNLDLHELDLRKGLIDPVGLNARWGERITLLHNGRIRTEDVKPDNMNSFTWIMTIVTCCLDVAVPNTLLKEIVVALLTKIFENKATNHITQYLDCGIHEHIDGWRSASCARGMAIKARIKWADLEMQRHRLPGFIPNNESKELVRFLQWLIVTKENVFSTASSDVFALAMLMQDIGLDMMGTFKAGEPFDESVAAVVFDKAILVGRSEKSLLESQKYRKGMRVPLQSLSELVSLWPGSVDSNNRRRRILADGMSAGSGLQIRACSSKWGNRDLGIAMQVESNENEPLPRVATPIYGLAERFLLVNTIQALNALEKLVDSWGLANSKERTTVIEGLGLIGRRGPDFEYHADLQIFLLGYYYAALSPLLDTRQLPVQEAFGSWGWNDIQFFDEVMSLRQSRLSSRSMSGTDEALYWRYQLLKLVSYLFAGAQESQIAQIESNVVGVLGKIAVLSASLMGEVDTPEKATPFVLLQLDPASVPRNQKGLLIAGKQPKSAIVTNSDYELPSSTDLRFTQDPDYTSHIEPDWDYDVNHTLVVYRYKGRIVHKISPAEIEAAVLEWFPKTRGLGTSLGNTGDDSSRSHREAAPTDFSPTLLGELTLQEYQSYDSNRGLNFSGLTAGELMPRLCQVPTSAFCGGNVLQGVRNMETIEIDGRPFRWARDAVTLVHSKNLPKARTCILAMYADHYADKLVTFANFPWQEHFEQCIPFETRNGGMVLLL